MAEVLLFHHAQGLSAGCLAFADELRAAGHMVHAPDLYEGRTFAELEDGVAYARQVGFDTIMERGRSASANPAVLHMSRVPHPGREPLSLRPERTCVGGAAFDPSGQLTFRPKVLSIDPQPPLHQLATHLRQASGRLRDEPG